MVVSLSVSGHVNFKLNLARQSLVWPNMVIFLGTFSLLEQVFIFGIVSLSADATVMKEEQLQECRLQFINLKINQAGHTMMSHPVLQRFVE